MSRKSKIGYEEKIRIVEEYLSGKAGYGESVRKANNSRRSFAQWVMEYKQQGEEALLPKGQNTYYTEEIKKAAVKAYLAGEGSLMEVSQKYGIGDINRLRGWLKVYNAHGDFNSVKYSGGGSYMKQGRKTTWEERIQIARECMAAGKNYGEMALKYQVSYQQVRTWTLRFEEMGEAGLQDRRGCRKKDQNPRTELERAQIEIEQLKHKLYLAEMERDLLKKWAGVERSDASQK